MSKYYEPKRSRNLFDPHSKTPFRLSRSKIELFMNCPRCFYLDRRLGIGQPPGFPFNLNSAVDHLLKKEFDHHRKHQTPHILMKRNNIKAVPFSHEKLDEWRDALRAGITFHHQPTNFVVGGGIDDVWVNDTGELLVVDYKSTAKNGPISLDAAWQIAYKRQVEMYQWLFRQNGFKVSPMAYFVYCNGDLNKESFNEKLEFNISVIPYEGDDSWVEGVLHRVRECLLESDLPKNSPDCDFCRYRHAARSAEINTLSL